MAASWRFDAIGAPWQIDSPEPLDERVRAEVGRVVEAFDATWSRFRPDSLVRALAEGGTAPLPADGPEMLGLLAEAADATHDAVNPLVGGSLDALGYDPAYSLRAGDPVPAPAGWRSVLRWDRGELSLSDTAVIDVGCLGKGRLVDLVLATVCARVDGEVVVDASGDLAVRGGPLRVGLEHPFRPGAAIGVWEVRDGALCASATNRRAWGEGLHHVLDARTGVPVRTVAATWAVASDAMHADAAATALFFEGGDAFAAARGISWVRMLTDGRAEFSAGCGAELFTRQKEGSS